MGHCGASAHDCGDGGVSSAGSGTGETGAFSEFGETDITASESARKVGGVDLRPMEASPRNIVSASDPWRSEDRRHEAVHGAIVAPRGKFSGAGQWLLLAFVQLYRVFLSPFLGGACKFYPSCSQYAQEAIALHGAGRGSVLALKRLGRCRPFTKGGFDPVPDSMRGDENLGVRHAHKHTDAADNVTELRTPGLIAASRDRHDYSDAEWLRTTTKELVQ
jgi:uncharacterized protein